MKKSMQIYWSPIAEEFYLDILKYILETWTIKEAEDFEKKVDRVLKNISQNKNTVILSLLSDKTTKLISRNKTCLIFSVL